MVLLLEIVVEALLWVILLVLRILLEFTAEILLRGFIWLLAWIFRATGRQITLGSRVLQLMVGVRLANAGRLKEALGLLPAREDNVYDEQAWPLAFALTRAWIFACQGEWDDVRSELALLSKPEALVTLQPRSLPLLSELAWAAGDPEISRSALAEAAGKEWSDNRSAAFDDLMNHCAVKPEAPPQVWPPWSSKLRIKWGPISVGEQRLVAATRKLRSGWRSATKDEKRKGALNKLEKVTTVAPGSVMALFAEAEILRLQAEAGMYR